jgi:hypothetical protein
LNSAANRATSSPVSALPSGACGAVSASPNSFSADRDLRTETRRSCRNSVSMSRSTPGTFASTVSSSRSRIVAAASAAGMRPVIGAVTLFE